MTEPDPVAQARAQAARANTRPPRQNGPIPLPDHLRDYIRETIRDAIRRQENPTDRTKP